MPQNYDYERYLLGYMQDLKTSLLTRPINLGGVAGAGGGIGGTPAGYIGYLAQSRVAFDTSEDESMYFPVDGDSIPSGASLVHNLNRIRYRIRTLEDSLVTVSGILSITVSASAPSSPSEGDLWVDIS